MYQNIIDVNLESLDYLQTYKVNCFPTKIHILETTYNRTADFSLLRVFSEPIPVYYWSHEHQVTNEHESNQTYSYPPNVLLTNTTERTM